MATHIQPTKFPEPFGVGRASICARSHQRHEDVALPGRIIRLASYDEGERPEVDGSGYGGNGWVEYT